MDIPMVIAGLLCQMMEATSVELMAVEIAMVVMMKTQAARRMPAPVRTPEETQMLEMVQTPAHPQTALQKPAKKVLAPVNRLGMCFITLIAIQPVAASLEQNLLRAKTAIMLWTMIVMEK